VALILAAFDDEMRSAAGPSATVDFAKFGTDHDRWIESGVCERETDHGGGRALAVRAGDRQAGFALHQSAEHLCVRTLRNPPPCSRQAFGVISGNSRTVDEQAGLFGYEGAFVARVNPQAASRELGNCSGSRAGIGTGDGPTRSGEQFGESLHTCAADSHEVNGVRLRRRHRKGERTGMQNRRNRERRGHHGGGASCEAGKRGDESSRQLLGYRESGGVVWTPIAGTFRCELSLCESLRTKGGEC
jgi:hypothetical protein